MPKKKQIECPDCADQPVIGMLCEAHTIKTPDDIDITLITDYARYIAIKLADNQPLSDKHRIFASNVLNDYADRLDRRSNSVKRTDHKTNAAKIQQVKARKLRRKFEQLCTENFLDK